MRAIAIERAIGEVSAALYTFWDDAQLYKNQYDNLHKALKLLLEDCR
jgi:hypothetical protein